MQIKREYHRWISDHESEYNFLKSHGGGGSGGSSRKDAPSPGEHARRRLIHLVRQRIRQSPPPEQIEILRFPVGIFFVRDRRTGEAANIREEIDSSFEFWDRDSGDQLDVFFPGWYHQNNKLAFNLNRFMSYRSEIECSSKWRYSGETDLLILNFDYDMRALTGNFSFAEAIVLPVESMIREKLIESLPRLLNMLQSAAKESSRSAKRGPVWEMSDRIGFLRGRSATWHAIKKTTLRDFADAYDKIAPFGVCDLRLSE